MEIFLEARNEGCNDVRSVGRTKKRRNERRSEGKKFEGAQGRAIDRKRSIIMDIHVPFPKWEYVAIDVTRPRNGPSSRVSTGHIREPHRRQTGVTPYIILIY